MQKTGFKLSVANFKLPRFTAVCKQCKWYAVVPLFQCCTHTNITQTLFVIVPSRSIHCCRSFYHVQSCSVHQSEFICDCAVRHCPSPFFVICQCLVLQLTLPNDCTGDCKLSDVEHNSCLSENQRHPHPTFRGASQYDVLRKMPWSRIKLGE